MSSFFQVKFFWEVFGALLVSTDPPGIVPVFLGMTRGRLPANATGSPGRLRSQVHRAGLTSSSDSRKG